MRTKLSKSGLTALSVLAAAVLALLFLLLEREPAAAPGLAGSAPALSSAAETVSGAQSHRSGRQPLAGPGRDLTPGLLLGPAAHRASELALVFAESLTLRACGFGRATGGKQPPLISPQGLAFEESLSPSLADQVCQVDFALAQSLRRLNLPLGNIFIDADELRDDESGYYHYKSLRVYAGEDLPLYLRTLRDCLLAWAEGAVMVKEFRLEGEVCPEDPAWSGSWNIVLDGVVTHTLNIFSGRAADPDVRERGPGGKQALLVIVMDDLGESTRQADFLLALSYPVTLAIWPHSTHAGKVAAAAQAKGAEILVHQPMEPMGYPEVDPGPGVLLNNMGDREILAILDANLAKVPQAVGLNNHMGSWLTQNGRIMALISSELKRRDMIALDSRTHARSQFAKAAAEAGLTVFKRDIFLDVQPDKASVLEQLHKAEHVALLRGQAIAIGHPLPGTLEALQAWQKERNPDVRIVRLRDLQPFGE